MIRALREFYELRAGVAEIKQMLDSVPRTVRTGLTREEAECLQKRLEAAGATAEIKDYESFPQ